MSTSDDHSKFEKNEPERPADAPYRPVRVIVAYIAVSAFLLVFGAVYEHFSHGVETPFMRLAFLVPLIEGVPAAAAFLIFKKLRRPGKYSRSIFRWSCACLTAASLLRGVFVIYGTDSIFPLVYLIAGMVCLIAAAAVYIAEGTHRGERIWQAEKN